MPEIFENGGMDEYREYQEFKKRLPKRRGRRRQIEDARQATFDFEGLFGPHEHQQPETD